MPSPISASDPAETEALGGIVSALRRELGAAACSVALVDGSELVFVAADGAGAEDVVGLRIPVSRGIAGWVTVSGQPIAVADVRGDGRFDRETAEQTGYVPTNILAVPIEGDDTAYGVLEVLDRRGSTDDLEAAARAARLAALVHALARRADGAAPDQEPDRDQLEGLVGRLLAATPPQRRLAVRLLEAVLVEGGSR